jgi:hypothetical protein
MTQISTTAPLEYGTRDGDPAIIRKPRPLLQLSSVKAAAFIIPVSGAICLAWLTGLTSPTAIVMVNAMFCMAAAPLIALVVALDVMSELRQRHYDRSLSRGSNDVVSTGGRSPL